MKLFNCQHCSALLFFENRRCEGCSSSLGYLPERGSLEALVAGSAEDDSDRGEGQGGGKGGGDTFTLVSDPLVRVRRCRNARHDVCNWLVNAESDEAFCAACRHNRTIPNLTDPNDMLLWRKLETAKHRLFYSLIRLGVRLTNRNDDPAEGLVFDFLDDRSGKPRVITGHKGGVITIAIQEADDAHREQMRNQMHETYRTLLGHFRHEVGHWIWDRLIRDGDRLAACREVFGDDTVSYAEALDRHYRDGPPPDWQNSYISSYATSHPWEDFAETWAHYLHIMDTLETANAFGMGVHPKVEQSSSLTVEVAIDPYRSGTMTPIVDQWLPLTFAMNNLNRSMGLADLYPFVITEPVRTKLGFIHQMLQETRRDLPGAAALEG